MKRDKYAIRMNLISNFIQYEKNIPILKHPQLIIFCRFAFLQFQPIRIQCHGYIKIIEFRENHEAKTGDLRNFLIFGEISVFLNM